MTEYRRKGTSQREVIIRQPGEIFNVMYVGRKRFYGTKELCKLPPLVLKAYHQVALPFAEFTCRFA